MAESERKDRTRFRSGEIWWMLGLLASGVALGGVAACLSRGDPELSRIFVTGTVGLVFGSLLGGVVSLLIADFDRRRVQRAAQLEFISNVLNDLKGVYDRIDRGRTLIAAHQSAKTYGEQMREFIDARVKLLGVLRALRFDERRSPILLVRADVAQMEAYVHLLTAEFEQHYKDISRSQSIYEARMKHALEPPLPMTSAGAALPANSPWAELTELPHLKDFLGQVDDCEEENAAARASTADRFCCRLTVPPTRCVRRSTQNWRRCSGPMPSRTRRRDLGLPHSRERVPMDPAVVALLKAKVSKHLPQSRAPQR